MCVNICVNYIYVYSVVSVLGWGGVGQGGGGVFPTRFTAPILLLYSTLSARTDLATL